MIEFKGECGHIIRARDEDAGKVVRCAYCGKEAVAVLPARDPDGSLLAAVEQTGVYDAQATKTSRKSARARRRDEKRLVEGKPVQQELDPFAIAMKMIYVAVIIIVLAVAWKYGSQAYETWMVHPTPRPTPASGTTPAAPPAEPRVGLVAYRLNRGQTGAYVTSVPTGALIFHLPTWDAEGALFDDPLANKNMQTDAELRLAPGRHSLGLAMRINDPGMMEVPGYGDLRRQIESGEYDDAKLMGGYFVPDGSVGLRTVRIHGVIYLVRVYEIEVETRTWIPVTALFLPRVPLREVMNNLPQRPAFVFDEPLVRRELEYYEVPERDCPVVLEVLRRVGKVCYHQAEDKPYRLFQVGLLDGLFTSESLGY